jgi:hypothetical protein
LAAASAGGRTEAGPFRSRFEIGLGLARGVRADSAETHVSVGAGLRAHPSARFGLGVEASAQELQDAPNHASLGVLTLTVFGEIRTTGARRLLPFAAIGLGLYSWRRCEGTVRDDIYACSVLSPEKTRAAFGGWIGAGVHTGFSGTRSVSFGLRLDPATTFPGGRPFFRFVVSLGF